MSSQILFLNSYLHAMPDLKESGNKLMNNELYIIYRSIKPPNFTYFLKKYTLYS